MIVCGSVRYNSSLAFSLDQDTDSQARQIFRDLVDMPATVDVTDSEVTVSFHRRAHLPILIASGLFEQLHKIPW